VKQAVAAIALAAGIAVPALAHEAEAPPAQAAFALPEPGSYELPPIARVAEFELLDEAGTKTPLLGLAPDQVAVVSFIYSRCGDGSHGCPAALAVLQRLDRAIAADPALASRVRLATVSFDPAHDTPARMAELRRSLAPATGWRFLTAADARAIAPVLAAFGQDALPLVGEGERALGLYRHVLKLFLVDANGGVRNIYSSGFLSPELLLVDARTVLSASSPGTGGAASR
jgi:cytochrome oxidase Cu insertion factor (SCO1/SenC/PrrC family)